MEKSLSYQARREVLQQIAPQYRQASPAQKKTLLEAFIAATGYVRKYARWLLNHAEEVEQTHGRSHRSRYGPDVQHALFLVWHAANRICAKRLIPFLPTLLEALERHEHLHISEECRKQLLSMSAATADRLLSSQRICGQRGLSTTRAGTLLKQQIPIRTFEQWNETRPGFLEADLVAHCGADIEGGYLYTLTLTDVATGWTECLPLLYRSQETVLAALQRARTLFPFPILGIDTDNGGEFINEALITYCEQAHISFTRGRPSLKNDQCFVEQKNGAIVRQVVGYDRLVGEHAYRQLTELYRGLRLYVNCFQPSMKLQFKQRDGKKVRYVYDPAKTPLQRLLLSGVLPAQKQQELSAIDTGDIDAAYTTEQGLFCLEWETGNISSSHRAINKMALGMLKGILIGGVLVVPSGVMKVYLTDRIGNFPELQPYFPLWRSLKASISEGLLAVISIEQDALSFDVPRIGKGTDGRALA